MWYIAAFLLTVSPIIVGIGAVIGNFVVDEFYKYPLYDNYDN